MFGTFAVTFDLAITGEPQSDQLGLLFEDCIEISLPIFVYLLT